MDYNPQPTGEAQNSQNKEWYKNWWGVIIAILLLPIFIIWYVWAKTDWGNKAKWAITIVVVILTIGAMNSTGKNDQTSSQPQQNAPAQEASNQNATPQAPQFVFDVPLLVGKNINEIKSTLGDPTDFQTPTAQDFSPGDNGWVMTFVKNDIKLIVDYNYKTNLVYTLSLDLDKNDKQTLLTEGNLKENSDDYNLKFNTGNIGGVVVSKKLPDTLDATVSYGISGVKIVNNEADYDWQNCNVEINPGIISSGYSYQISGSIAAKGSKIVSFLDFTKDGQRFDLLAQKPETISLTCDTEWMVGQDPRTSIFHFN